MTVKDISGSIKELTLLAVCVLPALCLAGLWQWRNLGYPGFDEAEFFCVALRNYQHWHQWGYAEALQHLYLDRNSFRPTLMPVVVFPFLQMVDGDVGSAARLAPLILFSILLCYAFAFFRQGNTWGSTVAGMWGLSLTTWILHLSHILSAELVYILCITAAWVHFELSRSLTSKGHSLLTGWWTGLSLCIRPLEALLIVCPCLAIYIFSLLYRQRRSLASLRTLASVLGILLLGVTYQWCSPHPTDAKLWAPTVVALVCLLPLCRAPKPGPGNAQPCYLELPILVGSALAFLVLLPFLPALKYWILSNSVGNLSTTGFWNAPADPLFRGMHTHYVLARIPLLMGLLCGLARHLEADEAHHQPKTIPFRGMVLLGLMALPFLKGFSHNGLMRLCYSEMFLLHLVVLRYIVSPWRNRWASRLALTATLLWAIILAGLNYTRISRIDFPPIAETWFGSKDNCSWSGQSIWGPPFHAPALEFFDWLAQQIDRFSPPGSRQRVKIWYTGATNKFDVFGIVLAAQEGYGDERVYGRYPHPEDMALCVLQEARQEKADFLLCGGPAAAPLLHSEQIINLNTFKDHPDWTGQPHRLFLLRIKTP